MAQNLFIDPTNFSAPSSPSASSCTHEDIDPTHSAGPTRKRVRSQDVTSEERREARAHRNRVAAQNSRNRRKAQFADLERRVAELEEENRLLRAGADIRPAELIGVRGLLERDRMGAEHDRARERERENEELKERVRTLERGWDVVLSALAAQGLPTGVSSALTSTTTTVVEPTITKPSSSMPEPSCFPSPAPSHSSLGAEPTPTPTTLAGPSSTKETRHVSLETTRHLAAGGLNVCADTPLSSIHASTPSQAGCKLSIAVEPNASTPNNAYESSGFEDDDKVMEALFREIVTSPCTAQDAMAENCKVFVAGSESPEMKEDYDSGWHLQLRTREGREVEDLVDEDVEFRDYPAWERTAEMETETERMLGEMIAMTGSVDGGESFAEYSDIGLSLGLWDMDAAVGCIGTH